MSSSEDSSHDSASGVPDARAGFVADLRSLADYLAANPEVPVPRYGWTIFVHATGTDEEEFAQVDAVSEILGEKPTDRRETSGGYAVVRSFGSVEYQFDAHTSDSMARHRAFMSYADSVEPETPAEPVRLAAEAFPADGDAVASHPAQTADSHRRAEIPRRPGPGRAS